MQLYITRCEYVWFDGRIFETKEEAKEYLRSYGIKGRVLKYKGEL